MLNTSCRKTGQDNGNNAAAAAVVAQPVVGLQDLDKSMRLQACWIRLWDRWACEQRNLVLYQMHINHALSRERSKLTLAGGRVVSCRRIKQHHQQQHQQQSATAVPVPPPRNATRCSSSSVAAGDADWPLFSRSSSAAEPVPPPAPEPSLVDVGVGGGGTDAVGARDLRVLSTAVNRLRASGWYYEGPEARDRASDALDGMPAGRFCVRDSKHSEHLFTIDVQTGRRGGEGHLVSVRFTYADGVFGLDMAPRRRAGAPSVPEFRCPIELIDYYVRLSRIQAARQMTVYPVWIDRGGQFLSWMNLSRPMVKTDPAGFPKLKHMARLVINRHKRLITITPTSLPNELIEYLLQYPYSL